MKRKTALAKRGTLLLLLFFITTIAFSQNTFKVSGKVLDENGKPVSGATVQVKGSSIATATSTDGSYSLMAPSGTSVLVVTSIGFTQMEVPINNKEEVIVTTTSTAAELQDIVVTGYTTVKRKDLTGSIGGINQKDIRARQADNALKAMQGKIAGVDISSNERPGTVDSIRIRGERSVNATNSPLYVVDNIPLTSGGIEYLNPNDIESIDVLKDASATAIYGSRGANGVVIVTTKQGKSGKTQINLYSTTTFETIKDWAPIMSASEYIDFRRWAVYYSNPAVRPRGDNPNI